MSTDVWDTLFAAAMKAAGPPNWKVTIVERWDGYMYLPKHGRIVEHTFTVTADDEAAAIEEAEWLIARKKVQPAKMDEVTRLAEFVAQV